jgi:hypothetical protein
MFNIRKELDNKQEQIIVWRNEYKYKQEDSPYGIFLVKQIFSSHYAMQYMWPELMQYVDGNRFHNYPQAIDQLTNLYNTILKRSISPNIDSWIENNPDEWVGGIHYFGFIDYINKSQKGDRKSREELEFSFLYYTLSDLCTIEWAAVCATGVSRIDAVAYITGCQIYPMPLDDYKVITNGLGQLYISRYLEENYTPLP